MINKESFVISHYGDIFSAYRKIKVIGEGAYGEVFRLQKKSTGEFFACKQILKSKIENLQIFTNEIHTLKAVDHPNIIKLYDIYEDKEYYYLIMEECMGGNFFDKICNKSKEQQMYSEREAALIFKQILEAVNYLHKHEICHRDIKPDNILFSTIEEDSPIKLIDFGFSEIFCKENSLMEDSMGTIFYMAPEVLQGKYTLKCDIWACGIILYVMLTGEAPFFSCDKNELIEKIISMDFYTGNPKLEYFSKELNLILKSIFTIEKKRPSAEQLLQSKWITTLAPNPTDAMTKINWDHLMHYSKLNLVQKCVINFSAFRLSDTETGEIVKMYKSLDENNDGVISIQEVSKGAKKSPYFKSKYSMTDLSTMYYEMDVDRNGYLGYNEFVSALIPYDLVLTKDKILDCFQNFDSDRNRKIRLNEFLDMINPQNEKETEKIKKLFHKFDKNGDGDIVFNEFYDGVMDIKPEL
ncbi:MAG: protein kinase [archaeon]|nr:protein kinase [archaeon]